MTDGSHALGWLEGRDGGSRSYAAALDSTRAQQRHLQSVLHDGFATRRQILEWCHAVDVVAGGQTPKRWVPNLLRDRWTVACLVSDSERRDAICSEAPEAESVRRSVRRRVIRRTIMPAFSDALEVLRDRAGEHTDTESSNGETGVKHADRMHYVAGRPRLHQRAREQHDVLTTALRDPPQTESAILDWSEDAIHASEGHMSSEFVEAALDRHGRWWHALTTGPSVQLEWLLARDVVPACNSALGRLVADANEVASVSRPPREVPPG